MIFCNWYPNQGTPYQVQKKEKEKNKNINPNSCFTIFKVFIFSFEYTMYHHILPYALHIIYYYIIYIAFLTNTYSIYLEIPIQRITISVPPYAPYAFYSSWWHDSFW